MLSFLFLTLGTLSFGEGKVNNQIWTELLQKHVSEEGKVDYEGIKSEEDKLDSYLKELSENHPMKSWSTNEKLAYWINAYNAFTVKLIVKNLPVNSIKELGGKIYQVNTTWDIKFIKIGTKTYNLNNIEHGIIRKKFKEPRIHFALNCASVSCPRLRTEAFEPSKLNEQLEDQARYFINESGKNKIAKDSVQLSKIFKWYKGDFTKTGITVIEFINRYSEVKVEKNAKITFFEYDWNLND